MMVKGYLRADHVVCGSSLGSRQSARALARARAHCRVWGAITPLRAQDVFGV